MHVAVHKGLGMKGAATNGVMRDLDVIDDGFPILAGSIGPSHGFVHVPDLGCQFSVKGMQVDEDDLLHADRHGAIVIPDAVIALKSRTAPVEEAVAGSLAALEWLRAAGAKQFFWKYCSTFDSTPKGNIGPVAEALMEALGTDQTI